ncbi:hypothetical protein [Streptomyces sp. CA-111067]|uniref:hypothetical protein n=1 Tax=Streptomyces sp. CA-111067 TaxID=3240046 RepID=UPI003D9851E7
MSGDQHPGAGDLVDGVTAGPGGVMTVQVGVVSGELTVATRQLPDGRARVAVQYTGAEEWYEIQGSPLPVPDGGLPALHQRVLDGVRAGGPASL